jgi:hypothetical protein
MHLLHLLNLHLYNYYTCFEPPLLNHCNLSKPLSICTASEDGIQYFCCSQNFCPLLIVSEKLIFVKRNNFARNNGCCKKQKSHVKAMNCF